MINNTCTINRFGISKNNLLPEAIIYCCLQSCDVVASEADTCVTSLTVIDITIDQLRTNVSIIIIY